MCFGPFGDSLKENWGIWYMLTRWSWQLHKKKIVITNEMILSIWDSASSGFTNTWHAACKLLPKLPYQTTDMRVVFVIWWLNQNNLLINIMFTPCTTCFDSITQYITESQGCDWKPTIKAHSPGMHCQEKHVYSLFHCILSCLRPMRNMKNKIYNNFQKN